MSIKLILASKSPRRKAMLKGIGVPFEVRESSYKEEKHDLPPNEFVIKNAVAKAESIAENLDSGYVIGVDTVASFQHHILEKPVDEKDALKMIKLLSGTEHKVFSGVCVINAATGQKTTAVEFTKVKFTDMTSEEVENYVMSGEWKDKAGGFAIQGLGSLFIEKIEGDFHNVVGLPLFRLYKMFRSFGVDLLKLRAENTNQSSDS